jgi:hypothetical protein
VGVASIGELLALANTERDEGLGNPPGILLRAVAQQAGDGAPKVGGHVDQPEDTDPVQIARA